MKAYVITHSSPYEPRAEEVGVWLQEQGVEVTWIFADFDHRRLKTVPERRAESQSGRRPMIAISDEPEHVYLHMDPYPSNLSPKRMQSVQKFAREVESYLSSRQADLLYFLIPANSFVPVAGRLKKKTGARIVLDIIDLWPESLPLAHVDRLPLMYAWKQLRDRGLSCGDVILTECNLYRELLTLPREKTHTLYWFRKDQHRGDGSSIVFSEQRLEDNYLHIAYIGAINNIIDTQAIAGLLKLLQRERPVVVDVIGYGKKKEAFLRTLDEAGVQSEDYGAVFDEEEKAEILRGCAFGLNMMVPQVRVGLTMKSLDYLAYGLPLLNNIAGDTWQLVEEYEAGINIPRDHPDAVIPQILAMADDPLAGRDARRLYEEHFSEENFRETLAGALRPLLQDAGLAVQDKDPALHREQTETGGDRATAIKPRISVAMTACNGELYLPQQLDSILPQLSENDEVIVSVDPSQDRTFEILFEYAAKDPRIRVLEGPGKGVIRNVEKVLEGCRGQMIFLSDQDDVWMPDKIEKVSKTLEHNTLVLHDAQIVDANLEEMAPSFMRWRRSRKGLLANIRKNSYIGCCMAFRSELLEHILPFPENLPMHDQWIGLLAEKHGSVRLLRVPLIRYRRHGTNTAKMTHANPTQMLQWRAEIAKEVIRR